MRLLKNPFELKQEISKFILNSDDIILLVPFIKLDAFRELFENASIKIIVTRWKPLDIILGSSDLDLFPYCEERGIELYLNNHLHLKAVIDNYGRIFLGSMNISKRAITEDKQFFNHEIGNVIDNLSMSDILYFKGIIDSSIRVDKTIYESINTSIEELDLPILEYPEEFDVTKNSQIVSEPAGARYGSYSIKNLPKSRSPALFIEYYYGKDFTVDYGEEDFFNDYFNLSLKISLEREEILNEIGDRFFDIPIIRDFIVYFKEKVTMGFSEVLYWFYDNATDSSELSREELKERISNLFDWVQDLSNRSIKWHPPGYRQQLFYLEKYRNEMLPTYIDRIKTLNVDTAHGFRALNKPILLLSVLEAFQKGELRTKLELNEYVVERFKYHWSRNSKSSAVPNYIMPLYHLQGEGFWKLIYKSRNYSEPQIKSLAKFKEKVRYVRLNDDFYGLLAFEEFRIKLISTLKENLSL